MGDFKASDVKKVATDTPFNFLVTFLAMLGIGSWLNKNK